MGYELLLTFPRALPAEKGTVFLRPDLGLATISGAEAWCHCSYGGTLRERIMQAVPPGTAWETDEPGDAGIIGKAQVCRRCGDLHQWVTAENEDVR